jgi:type VI secretion system protein ImpB
VAKQSSQKFIGRNRAPRVQIEYDVELYGAQKKVQVPFVMGVMADLSGDAKEPLPGVDERKFLNFDVDNFDDRMKSMKPRVAFSVPNTLTGEGNMRGHHVREHGRLSPAAVARKVTRQPAARGEIAASNLITYMDEGRRRRTIAKVLNPGAAQDAGRNAEA